MTKQEQTNCFNLLAQLLLEVCEQGILTDDIAEQIENLRFHIKQCNGNRVDREFVILCDLIGKTYQDINDLL